MFLSGNANQRDNILEPIAVSAQSKISINVVAPLFGE